jgi:hypothetical protein
MMIYQRSMNRLMYAEVRSAVNLKISPWFLVWCIMLKVHDFNSSL